MQIKLYAFFEILLSKKKKSKFKKNSVPQAVVQPELRVLFVRLGNLSAFVLIFYVPPFPPKALYYNRAEFARLHLPK